MSFIELLLVAVGLAMDAFAVSVSSGIAARGLRLRNAVKTGLFFGVFQAAMPTLGYFLGQFFASCVESISAWVAFGLLVFIGVKMLYESLRPDKEERAVTNDPFGTKVLLILAVATSIDALAVGITLAFLPGSNIFLSAGVIGAVAFVISVAGVILGKKTGDLLGNKAEIAGGLILIAIGIKILVQYLMK